MTAVTREDERGLGGFTRGDASGRGSGRRSRRGQGPARVEVVMSSERGAMVWARRAARQTSPLGPARPASAGGGRLSAPAERADSGGSSISRHWRPRGSSPRHVHARAEHGSGGSVRVKQPLLFSQSRSCLWAWNRRPDGRRRGSLVAMRSGTASRLGPEPLAGVEVSHGARRPRRQERGARSPRSRRGRLSGAPRHRSWSGPAAASA